jgi:type II secretory pathway pseudopilin PulG
MDTMRLPRRTARQRRNWECGFSLIDALLATVVLVFGLVALAGVFAQSLQFLQYTREDLVAKQKAHEALEGVYSARNDSSVGFNLIQNRSSGGIFNDGFQPLFLPGTNGIAGTTSDSTTLDSETLPGEDGLLGTSDDVIVPLTYLRRQILIQPVTNPDLSVSTDLRQITVTVRVTSPGWGVRDHTVTGYISRYQ